MIGAWILFGLWACAPKPPAVGTQVRSIKFEGTGPWLSPRSQSALRNAMAHPKPRGFGPFRRLVPLDEQTLNQDTERIAVHYAHQGYFDGRLVRWEQTEVRPGSADSPPVVTLRGFLEEGDPQPVTTAQWTGMQDLPPPLANLVERQAPPVESTFTITAHDLAKSEATRTLKNHAYAHARVTGAVEVDSEDDTLDITYAVDPGPVSTFGDVTVRGGDVVPERFVSHAVTIAAGKPYSLDTLEETRQRLYGMRTFSLVRVTPQLDTPKNSTVPISIALEPRAPRTLAAGFGIQLQNGRQEALVRTSFEHVNLLEKLIGFQAELQVGYAVLSTSLGGVGGLSGSRQGPIADVEVSTTLPGIGPTAWNVKLAARYQRQLTAAFVTDQPELVASWSGPLHRYLDLSLSYRLRYTRYSDIQVDLDQLGRAAGSRDLIDGRYFVTELQQTLLFDIRDSPLSPRRGQRHSLRLTQAGRWSGGNYDYLGAEVDLRAYRSLVGWGAPNSVLAGRVGAGILSPYGAGESAAIPTAERLYLGGADSVRGWVYQHLGPYVCSFESEPCNSRDDPATQDQETVPIGGQLSANASLEFRQYGDLVGGVLFSDWGMVWSDREAFGRDTIITPTVGAGGRIVTPAGPVRLDIAFRTDDVERFSNEPRFWVHLGLGEAF